MFLSRFMKPYTLPAVAGSVLIGGLAFSYATDVLARLQEKPYHEVVTMVQLESKAPQPKESLQLEPLALSEPEPEPKPPEPSPIIMNVTGYTAGYESTGKHPGHPEYGLTASGAYVEQGRTIAAGPDIPFGTKIYIPHFDGKPGFGDGIFIVEDRGGAIGNNNIDVYFESLSEALEFGRNNLEVYILEEQDKWQNSL